MVMSLKEWLKADYGVDFHADPGMGGDAQAAALFRTLEAAGLDYGLQRAILLEAGDRHQVLSFGTACLDRVDAIDAYLARRAATAEKEVRRCHPRVSKNKDWAAGAEYADLRFAAARTVDEDSVAVVEEMVRRLAAEGYVELHPDVVRDLRQGLGYYRAGEDPVRRRHTVRWLRGLNALHFWIDALLGGREPLIRVADGAPGCWVTAASLFVDVHGCALTNQRLEHGILRNDLQRQWLLSIIPRTPRATARVLM